MATCFYWNESVAKRGSREILFCLYTILESVDNEAYTSVQFFSASCVGQNKMSFPLFFIFWSTVKLVS